MTRDQRVHKLALTGAPKFARIRPNAKTEGLSKGEGKQIHPPQTPDSGFSDGPNKPQQEAVKASTIDEAEGDYGVASVIHVVEPDPSAARHWWHTKGFKSDPYKDGTLPLPTVRQSKAADEAKEATRRNAIVREQLKLETVTNASTIRNDAVTEPPSQSNTSSTAPYSESNLQHSNTSEKNNNGKKGTFPVQSGNLPVGGNRQALAMRLIGAEDVLKDSKAPRNSMRGESFTGKVLKSSINSSLARVNLNRLGSSNNTVPDPYNVNKQLTSRGNTSGDQGNLKSPKTSARGKTSAARVRDRSAENKSPSSVPEVENTNGNKVAKAVSKGIRGSVVPVATAARRSRGTVHKSSSKEYENDNITDQAQEGCGRRRELVNTTLRSSTGVGGGGGGGGSGITRFARSRRPIRPSSTSVCEGKHAEGHTCHSKISLSLRSHTPPRRSRSPAVSQPRGKRARSKSPGVRRGRSVTPDGSKKRLGRLSKVNSFPTLPIGDRGRSALKKERDAINSHETKRARSPRKVCFVTENDGGTESTMNGKSSDSGQKDTQSVNPPAKKTKKTRMAKKKSPGKPTQRALDNDAILDVAQANKFGSSEKKLLEDETKKGGGHVTSDSEPEEDETKKSTKNPWELFEEQVKSIDDGNIQFSPRDLTSKSSDLFEKVMWEVGPQFRRPTKSDDADTGEESAPEDIKEAVSSILKKNPSIASRFKTKRGWNLLRKTMMEIHIESGKTEDASLNWKFLCTTISNLTDMQKGREALYQKYIYDPNSWMQGFTTPPNSVLKQGHKNKFREPVSLRSVHSANGRTTVVTGHQAHDDLSLQGTGAKLRSNSTQNKIKVSPYKSSNNTSTQSLK